MTERRNPSRRVAMQRQAHELCIEYRACIDADERRTLRAELPAVDAAIRRQEHQAETLARLPAVWETVYGPVTGFLALFSGQRGARRLERPQEAYFPYPEDTTAALSWIVDQVARAREVYQCAHLTTEQRRRKATAAPIASLWVDLDHDHIEHEAVPPPTVTVQSSPGRLQAYWRLREPIDTATAEHYNRQLAERLGADASGWDATQLLRVPGSGKEATLPPPPPLRTVRDSFPSHGSSRSRRPARDAASLR
jgi:hypothetical protein